MKRQTLGLLFLCGFSATSLFAQTERKPEIAINYSNLQAEGLPDRNNSTGVFGTDFFNSRTTLHGFDSEVTFFPSDHFGLTGDFSFNANKRSNAYGVANTSLETDIFYFTGGPTFTLGGSSRLQPFARFLAGGAYTRLDVNRQIALPFETVSNTYRTGAADFALTTGGGLDLWINDSLKLRLFQVDYAPIFLRDQSIVTLTEAGAIQPYRLNGQRMDNVRFGFGIVF